MARALQSLEPLQGPPVDIRLDIAEEQDIRKSIAGIPEGLPIDWAFIATGWLHDSAHTPEKTYRNLDAEHLLHAYRINAVGPALLLKHLITRLNPGRACKVGIVSARVGSISDNRLGGWHAYRTSKAALNMLIQNFAIEWHARSPRTSSSACNRALPTVRCRHPSSAMCPQDSCRLPNTLRHSCCES